MIKRYGLMCLLATHLRQCWSSLCLHPGSGLLLLCFYMASLWLLRFLWVGRRRVVYALSFLCVWSQRPWRSRQIILLPLGFFCFVFCAHTHTDYLTKMGIKTVPQPPIVQTLLPVTFAYSLSSEAVVMRQWRRWKRLWRRSLTRWYKRTSMGPFRSCWNSTSGLQPEEITSKETRVSCVNYQ